MVKKRISWYTLCLLVPVCRYNKKKLCNQSQQKPDSIKIWLQGVFGTTAPTVPPE